ncbi:hypothetical protein BBP40_010723 [Aspergillus hancockii]|nr:hypothetical protein BBP40_010723 [Aspergillus hancockii]
MEDPYETGEGSEVWCTGECIGARLVPDGVPTCYQRTTPVSPRSSRSGTPVESEEPRRANRGVYVLPSPPLKRWLKEQSRVWNEEHVDFMTEEQFERCFTIKRSDWVFQFTECSVNLPTMRRMNAAISGSFNIAPHASIVMIYHSDMRSPVARVDGCLITPGEAGNLLGFRGSLIRA